MPTQTPTLVTLFAAGAVAAAALVSASVHTTRFWHRHQKGLTISATRQSGTACTVEVKFNPRKMPRLPQMVIRGLLPRSLRLVPASSEGRPAARREREMDLRWQRPTGAAKCRMQRNQATFTARATLSSSRAFQAAVLLITVRDQFTHHRIDQRAVVINPVI